MKKYRSIILAILMLLVLTACTDPQEEYADAKPVIYLYPQEETEITVKLDYNGTLTSAYPEYDNGWTVLASPDGTLIDPDTGRTYYCLFWEGIPNVKYDFSQGFVVPGNETCAFLESALKEMGLTDKEADEFVIYWLPQMEHNAYNLITFQTDIYTESAKLEINPEPDSLLRVFMAWKPLEESIEIQPQKLPTFQRDGYTVVEWGGAKVSD